ncbi:flagellar hook-associated protein FlgK [Thermaurantiacus sp.]
MSDLLGLALSGVRAARTALETVADNVANAATPGYTRRVAQMGAILPATANSPFERDPMAAGGVDVRGIARAVDLILQDSLRRSEGNVAMLSGAERWLALAETSLSGPGSLAAPMSDFFSSLSDLAADPASLAVRAIALSRADALAQRFNAGAEEIARLTRDLETEGRVEADRLTSLARALAEVNAQLRRASPGGGAAAGLADSRDRILAEIAGLAAIDVQLGPKGEAQVRLADASGPLLVSADRSQPVALKLLPSGGFLLGLGPQGLEEGVLAGGKLLGLSMARRKLAEVGGRLDQLAERLAADINAVQQQGVDLGGADGQPLFATRRIIVTAAGGNGGTARITATLADGAAPPPLRLTWNAVDQIWRLARADNSDAVEGSFPLALDGVTVEGRSAPFPGDLFRLELGTGAAGLAARPMAPAGLAAAPRWLTDALATNRGGARSEVRVGAPLDPPPVPPLQPPFRVEAVAGGLFELKDNEGALIASGPAGSWLQGDGFEVRITGQAIEGDGFRIVRTGPNSGANGNALLLLSVRELQGAEGTLQESHDALVATLSVPLAETRIRQEAAQENRNAAAEAVAAAAGIDLNREAADMLRFQQAYQANARLIQTAREIFQTLIDAGR